MGVDAIEHQFLTYKKQYLLFLLVELLLENLFLLKVNKEHFHFLLYTCQVHST